MAILEYLGFFPWEIQGNKLKDTMSEEYVYFDVHDIAGEGNSLGCEDIDSRCTQLV